MVELTIDESRDSSAKKGRVEGLAEAYDEVIRTRAVSILDSVVIGYGKP